LALPRNRNELWARVLLDELARSGVRHLVVAPGSRSTPLVLAAAEDARFVLAVQVDERSAAFLALGVGKGTGRPAGVITTSGTAVANLLPAVVEASQSEVPLLLLTADRPPRLRGADANQAIDQVHIFGRYVRHFQELAPTEVSDRALRHLRGSVNRAVAEACGDPGGPVHLNLAFEKPLEPIEVPGDLPEAWRASPPLGLEGRSNGAPFTRIGLRRHLPLEEDLDALATAIFQAERPLFVAGPAPRPWESGPAILELARSLGVPLLADPLSGARVSRVGEGVPGVGYDLALRSPEARGGLRPDLMVRFGTTPSSAAFTAAREIWSGVPEWGVDGGERWKDHLARADRVVYGDPVRVVAALRNRLGGAEGGSVDRTGRFRAWAQRWAECDSRVAEGVRHGLESDFFEGAAAVAVAERVAHDPEGILFVSNSMPIRDLDALWPVGRGEADESPSAPLRILGNRGASGIDGIVSTALGVSWGTGQPVTVLLGDLALLHDMNGLLRADLPPRIEFVVVHNDGGGIFHLLPVRSFEPHFTPFVATPHGIEPERVASLHGLTQLRVEGRSIHRRQDAPHALALLREALRRVRESPGPVLLEVRTDREENRLRHQEGGERVRQALLPLFPSTSVSTEPSPPTP